MKKKKMMVMAIIETKVGDGVDDEGRRSLIYIRRRAPPSPTQQMDTYAGSQGSPVSYP
jgi:hypothetical protein